MNTDDKNNQSLSLSRGNAQETDPEKEQLVIQVLTSFPVPLFPVLDKLSGEKSW